MKCLTNLQPLRRQANIESKLSELETQKLIDDCVNKRIKDEIEKKDAAIDVEVCRRVENAKTVIEKELREELQAKKEEMERQMRELEVRCTLHSSRGLFANLPSDYLLETLTPLLQCY